MEVEISPTNAKRTVQVLNKSQIIYSTKMVKEVKVPQNYQQHLTKMAKEVKSQIEYSHH